MEQIDAKDAAAAVENRIYSAMSGLYHLKPASTIDIAGRVSLQMTAIVGDALLQESSTDHRLAAMRFIEDAIADLALLKSQATGPNPAHF